MKARLGITLAAAAILSQGALSRASAMQAGGSHVSLNVYYETAPVGLKFTAQVSDVPGRFYGLFARIGEEGAAGPPIRIGIAPVGQDLSFVVPSALVEAISFPVHFLAAYVQDGGIVFTDPADLALGVNAQPDELDFNYTLGDDDVMVAGRVIAEQWAEAGLHVSAVNTAPTHPDLAILFDSANPTGGDTDLATPNDGAIGNDTPLGNLLIIAENAIDNGPVDGLIDVPDDEAAGGSLIFDFDEPATIHSVTLVDIDEVPGTELRFYRNGNLTTPDETLSILSLGCDSVQRVTFLESDVDRFEVFLRGSGAVARMELVTCPRVVNFDETTLGVPRGLLAGETVTDQFLNLGLTISAVNANASHPDKAILFDSEHPTGGDTDLMTPNDAVPGNDEPLGLVLIIAENDVDVAPADGLVDDPDDEAAGGTIEFRFKQAVTFLSARVLDVDGVEVDRFRFFDAADVEITSIVIPNAPDGSVQLVPANVSGVRRAVLELGGSGAVTRIRFCPEPVGQ